MNVAELDDPIAMERVGEIFDGDGLMDRLKVMACDFARIERESCGGDAGTDEKFATGEAGRLIGFKAGHRS
jgi:hypothetical protein